MAYKVILIALLVLVAVAIAMPVWAQAPPDVYYNDFEFPDMRTIGGTGFMPVLAHGEMPNEPAGYCKGVLGSGICTGINNFFGGAFTSIVNDPGNCHSGSWCLRTDVPAGRLDGDGFLQQQNDTAAFGRTQTAPEGGPQSMACSHNADIGSPIFQGRPDACVTYDMYFRMWIKFQNGFEQQLTAGGDDIVPVGQGSCNTKIGAAYIAGYVGEGRWGFIISGRLTGQNFFAISVNMSNFGDPSSAWAMPTDGQWHSLEIRWNQKVNSPPGEITVWQDDVMKVDRLPFYNTMPAPYMQPVYSPYDAMEWGVYFNQSGNGNCFAFNPIKFWVDDFAVSTQRIGGSGGGADTTPPTIQITGPTSAATYLTRFSPLVVTLFLTSIAIGGLVALLGKRKRVSK